MGVPVLGRANGLRSLVSEGDEILLDADKGLATLRPTAQIAETFARRFARSRERQAAYAELRDVAPFPRCGTRIQVMMNAVLRHDMIAVPLTGSDGVGLFRTSLHFLVSAIFPHRDP